MLLVLLLALPAVFAQGNESSVQCILCGVAMNEVEAMLMENLTVVEIQTEITKLICDKSSGIVKTACDLLVSELPNVIKSIEHRDDPGRICVGLKLCPMPFAHHPDPIPAPKYVISLDDDPAHRWDHVCSMPYYQGLMKSLIASFNSLLPNGGKNMNKIGETLLDYFPKEFSTEIEGCAKALGVEPWWMAVINVGYEISDACTSMVAQTPDGKILHGRNLDFWDGWGFTDVLRNLTFEAEMQRSGKTVYKTTTLVGYMGVLSGHRPDAYSVTINTRWYPNGTKGLIQLFDEVIVAIKEKNASLVTFLSREVMDREENFDDALHALSDGELIADCYYTLAGTKAGEGVVISRNRLNATDLWRLDSPDRWFEVETNYDHWLPPPDIDDRRKPANDAMSAIGQKDISLDGMMKVLSTKPVLNLQTTHTILSCPATSEYHSYRRFCNFPCAE